MKFAIQRPRKLVVGFPGIPGVVILKKKSTARKLCQFLLEIKGRIIYFISYPIGRW